MYRIVKVKECNRMPKHYALNKGQISGDKTPDINFTSSWE